MDIWILNRLRSSPLELNFLARIFEGTVGEKIQDDWQLSVLKFWHQDGMVTAANPAPSLSLDFE